MYDLTYDLDDNPDSNKVGLTLVADQDQIRYDSYGSEDSTLSRVYRHEELDLYVKLTGTRCSYVGETWDGIKFVEPQLKEVTIYE